MTESEADEWAMENLSHIFVAERIPNVIRRKAPAFDGERAIDLIMRNQIDRIYVLAMYENAVGVYDGQ